MGGGGAMMGRGGGGMGGGMMGRGGTMGRGGMMGRGGGAMRGGGGMMGQGQAGMERETTDLAKVRRNRVPITRAEVERMAREYLGSTGRTDVNLGRVRETPDAFEVPLLSKATGTRIATLYIDKDTGDVGTRP